MGDIADEMEDMEFEASIASAGHPHSCLPDCWRCLEEYFKGMGDLEA